MQKHIDFARKVLQETVTAAESAANKQIKLYEKKHNIRTYTSGDTVFVDIGKRTKVKKHVNKQPAVVVEAFSGGRYSVVWISGDDEGCLFQADVDRIEPFYVREDSNYMKAVSDVRDKIKQNFFKGKQLTKNKGDANPVKPTDSTVTTPKQKISITKDIPATKTTLNELSEISSRSESYQWKLACSGEIQVAKERRRKHKIIADQ